MRERGEGREKKGMCLEVDVAVVVVVVGAQLGVALVCSKIRKGQWPSIFPA